ncbi:hypothetical protein OG946_15075 [Streptomyces sp. NBC_01808]|uniref:hypothetical protein n=1 Tax=Streptomyces sp. NBC_01808 TaxID=2975947 RepID=UPI002DD81E00|nr:hypothetical protein [Streptomyces sp. NBC_01808]WSA38582.1 hypothetical protein OG946_15075 [Streptomyces sp. NBC_01808]
MPTAEHITTLAALRFWSDERVYEFVAGKLAGVDRPAVEAARDLTFEADRISRGRAREFNAYNDYEPRDVKFRRLAAYDCENKPVLEEGLRTVQAAERAYVTEWIEKAQEWEWTPRIFDVFKSQKEGTDFQWKFAVQRASSILEDMQRTARAPELARAPSYEQVAQQERRDGNNWPTSPPFISVYTATPGSDGQTVRPSPVSGGPSRSALPAGQPARPSSRGR